MSLKCPIGSARGPVSASIKILGGHTGVYAVSVDGVPRPRDPDGTVPLGKVRDLIGKIVVVTTDLVKVSAGKAFTVRHIIKGVDLDWSADVDDSFADGENAGQLEEPIVFEDHAGAAGTAGGGA